MTSLALQYRHLEAWLISLFSSLRIFYSLSGFTILIKTWRIKFLILFFLSCRELSASVKFKFCKVIKDVPDFLLTLFTVQKAQPGLLYTVSRFLSAESESVSNLLFLTRDDSEVADYCLCSHCTTVKMVKI